MYCVHIGNVNTEFVFLLLLSIDSQAGNISTLPPRYLIKLKSLDTTPC